MTDSGTPSRTVRTAKALALVAAGAIGATALTGVAFAASGASGVRGSVTPASVTADDNGMGDNGMGMGAGMGRGGPGRIGGLMGQPLHGEGVYKKADGVIVTLRAQQGTVTAVEGSTLSVRSDDAYTADWTVGSAATVRRDRATVTVDKIKVGDHVMVVGEVKDGAVTVTRVMAFSPEQWKTMQERRAEMQKRFQERKNGATPAPATTS